MSADEIQSTLTGAAYDLANAGYTPMPDAEAKDEREAITSDSASLRDAATQLADRNDDVVVREYRGPDGPPAAANEAVTLSRAGRDYASATAAEKLVAENESSGALAARVDALRVEALANDPKAAEIYGFDPPKTMSDKAGSGKGGAEEPASELPEAHDDFAAAGLDPELEKALQHPQVRHAIEEQLSEAENTRKTYLNGLAAATQIAHWTGSLAQGDAWNRVSVVDRGRVPGVLQYVRGRALDR
jgi:hypothetical protein